MPRCASAIALLVTISFHFLCPALAQSSDGDSQLSGYWYRGEWNGFLPARNTVKTQPYRKSDPEAAVVQAAFEEPLQTAIDEQVLGREVSLPVASTVCGAGGCNSEACCETPRLWGRAEYLGWWTDGMRLPPLVTSSPAGTAQGQAGVLGQSSTSILYGDTGPNTDARSGGRITLGTWLDACEHCGVEFIYLGLGDDTETFTASNANTDILARPFFNVGGNQQDARLIAFSGLVSGSVSVAADTRFEGTEILFRRSAARAPGFRADYLLGYRWTQLRDSLRISESTLSLAGATNGIAFDLFDQFTTRNNFHGAELGLIIDRRVNCCWSLELLGKVALGNANMVVDVSGQTLTTAVDGSSSLASGGLLAQPTNIGRYEQNSFATVSELGLTLRRTFQCGLEATFGYRLVHWSEVARAGDQVDLGVNVSQLPPGPLVGESRPAFAFDTTDFWAQGLSVGLNYGF